MRAVLEDCDELDSGLCQLPFEELLQRPEASLRKVCDFVGLDFRREMLPAAGDRMPLGSRYVDRWYPLREDINQVYEQRLDERTIEVVNDSCGDVIERLGYEKRGTGRARKVA